MSRRAASQWPSKAAQWNGVRPGSGSTQSQRGERSFGRGETEGQRFQGIEILWLILVHQQTKISNPLQEITSDFRDPSLLYHLPVPKLHKSNFNFEALGLLGRT